jgi:hypothetical protein
MYCSSCGKTVMPGLSFCNHCGVQLSGKKKPEAGEMSEASFNFLIAALLGLPIAGIGVVIGLLSVMKKELGMADEVVGLVALFAFLLLALSEFGLLRLLLSSTRVKKVEKPSMKKHRPNEVDEAATRTLNEAQPFDSVHNVGSVTEDTTRIFEPAYREPKAQ